MQRSATRELEEAPPMDLPHVDPVGVTRIPADYVQRPRRFRRGARVAAGAVLAAFVAVGLATTAASLGAWCLTSHAGSPSPLPGPGEVRPPAGG